MDQVPGHFEWQKARGRPIPLSELQRLDDLASRGVDQDSSPSMENDLGMGTSFIPTGMQVIWAEITGRQTGSYALYSWRRIVTLNNQHTYPDGEASSSSGIYNLLEVSGNQSVPTGAVVPIWQSEDNAGENWRFCYPANPSPTPPEDCVEWYTGYMHLQEVDVNLYDTLSPGQRIGTIGPHPGGPHLHFSLGDGNPILQFGSPYSFAGQTTDVSGWLGIPIVGTFNPTVEGPGNSTFTSAELQAIRERTGYPIDQAAGYVNYRGSVAHTGKEYYAHDFSRPPTGDFVEINDPVYNAASTEDVITQVVFIGFEEGSGWAVLLRHTIGPCEAGSGVPGSGGPVVTDCCPDGMPETIYVTLDGSDDCECVGGTYTLTWFEDEQYWGTGILEPPCGNDDDFEIIVWCEDDLLNIAVICGQGARQRNWTGTSSTCRPMDFGTLTASGGAACCVNGSITATATTDEASTFVALPDDGTPHPSGLWVVTNVCPIFEYIEVAEGTGFDFVYP